MRTLFAIAPKLLQATDLEPFSHCLDFLKPYFKIDWFDPLEEFQDATSYYHYWRDKIGKNLQTYDVYIGFSLGGLLLVDSLDQFSDSSKVIILISTPSQLDVALKQKLTQVLNDSLSNNTNDAIQKLHYYIYGKSQDNNEHITLSPTITNRFQFGLSYVLNHKVNDSVTRSDVMLYQLVGANSQLVTKDNVLQTKNSVSQIVPDAGNRVLEDNPAFVQSILKEWLHVEK